jgi:hypothetical protein
MAIIQGKINIKKKAIGGSATNLQGGAWKMRNDLESVLRNVKKIDVPNSTFAKVDAALQNMGNRKGEKQLQLRYKKSVIIAAALIAMLLITGTVFAAVTFWSQQQAGIRDVLGIEGKDIPEYVEYDPADPESNAKNPLNEGDLLNNTESSLNENVLNQTVLEQITDNKWKVSVLSSMKDDEFIYYYISVSPVTLEQAENNSWFISHEGMEGWRFAGMVAGSLDKAYYENSQSLLLEFALMIGSQIDLDETEPYIITLLSFDMKNPMFKTDTPTTLSQLRELVPDAFTATDFIIVPNTTDVATVSFSFGDGVEFKNPQTGETGLILGAEVSAGSFVWIHSYPSMEEHFAALAAGDASYVSEQAVWINSFEDAIRNTVLVMSNGSTINAPIPMRTDIEGGTLRSHAHFEFPIELSALEDIIVYTGEDAAAAP